MSEQEKQLQDLYKKRLRPLVAEAPWVLRVTEHKGKPVPVVIVKERRHVERPPEDKADGSSTGTLRDAGLIYGASLRRCLPVIRSIVTRVYDDTGVPLELQLVFAYGLITVLGNSTL